MQKAEEACGEAFASYRKLADGNPDAYLPDVATTLNNIAYFYCSTGRIQDAKTDASEAEHLLDPRWLCIDALVFEAFENSAAKPCAHARRALAAAYDPTLRRDVQQLIDRLCPESVD